MRKVFTLLAAMAAIVSAEAQNVWNLQGKGTEEEPYLVSSAADFQSMAENISATNTGRGEYFMMTQDVDFGGSAESPVQLPSIGKAAISNITTVAYGFEGTFDGNGKSISGIYHTANGNDAAGKFNALFSSVGKDGTIKNLVFSQSNSISSYNYAAPIVCVCSGAVADCENQADITAANAFAAGICGYLINGTGTISHCINRGNISATTYACGIVSGAQSGAKITEYYYAVNSCKNYGDIMATTGTGASGIAGSYSGKISECVNHGYVSASKMYAAGIMATGAYAVNISQCCNEGNICCGKASGGIVGNAMKGDDTNITITGCTNNGTVTAEDNAANIGGIMGNSQRVNGTVTLSFCTNAGTVSGGDGKTVGNLRGNENIVIGEGCIIAEELDCLPLDPPATGIASVHNAQPDMSGRFNLQGISVDAAYTGIVITNGKKAIRR